MSRTIVYTDYYYDSVQAEFDLLSTLPDVRIVDLTEVKKGGITAPEELVEHVADADALVTQFAVINADVMDAMPNCRIIARHAIGVDTIDLTAARERGIVVSNVPDYCIEEVSDTAMAHILNGVRRIGEADRLLRAGEWAYSKIMPLNRFSEMTVGLLHGVSADFLAHSLGHAFEGTGFEGAEVNVTVVDPGQEYDLPGADQPQTASGWELLISTMEGEQELSIGE